MERSYMKLTNTHRLILEMLLHHPEGIRREDINEVLKREGERVLDDRRRLYKYLDSFRKSLGLNIATVHLGATDFKYRLCDTEGMPTGFAEQMVTNILENDFLQTFKDLGSRIQAVRIPRGSNFLKTIGLAMRNKRLLRVTYQKFDDVEPYDCILAPHALKAFEGRWYLFAVKWMSEDDVKQQPLGCKGIGLQTFALDRMLSVSITPLRCKLLKDFDADEFFKPYFGVFCPAGEQPKRIVVHASESDAHYIRTLPIHHTQKELEHNVFEVTLVPALDFDIYMRRYPETTWEVVDAIVL